MSGAEIASVSSEFDIFSHRPIQKYVVGTIETEYKPIATVDENELGQFIPANNDTYNDLDIKVHVRVKLISASGKDVNFTELTAVSNNFLQSLFSQYNVIFNGVTITQASEQYHYRSYLETLVTYGTNVAESYLSYVYWYLDTGDMYPSDPTAETLNTTSREFNLYGRLHSDICNVHLNLLPVV